MPGATERALASASVTAMTTSLSTERGQALHLRERFPRDSRRHGSLLHPEASDKCIRTQNIQGPRHALGRLDNACQCPGAEDGFCLRGRLRQAVVNVGSALFWRERRETVTYH